MEESVATSTEEKAAAKVTKKAKTSMKVKNLEEREEPSRIEVAQILGTRNVGGKTEYKIKWKDTWEPAGNLTNLIESLDVCKAKNKEVKAELCNQLPSDSPTSEFDNESNEKYPMKNRGAVLLINVLEYDDNFKETRVGSEEDLKNLRSLFEDMGYKVEEETKGRKEDIENSIINWKDQDCLSQFSCGIIILMAHGSEGQEPGTVKIATMDKKCIPSEWIIQNMSATNAPNLHERPKLIFILTCRGEHPDYGTDIDKLQQLMPKTQPSQLDAQFNGFFEPPPLNVAPQKAVPSLSDVLLVYPCAPGKANLRSWFVREMCEVFRKKAHKDDVETMLKEMDRNLTTKRPEGVFQTICTTSRGFNKKLFLNPVNSFAKVVPELRKVCSRRRRSF